MPELSRSQVAVYGAIAVALLLVGARAIRAEGGTEQSFASGSGGSSVGGSSSAVDFTLSGQASDLVVDVAGAVAPPRRLPAAGRGRVDDAVERAGGAAASAAAGSDQPRRPAQRRPAGRRARTGPGRRGRSRRAAATKKGRSASAPPPSSSSTRSTASAR